jgi:hypothetical protein
MAPPVPTPFGFKLAGNVAMAAGVFETEEIEVFLRLLQKASTCIDIGANIGLYTCLAAAQGKHVVAIEPLSVNLTALYRNLEGSVRSRGTAWPELQARSRPHRSRIERRRGRLCAVARLWGLFEVVTLDRLAAG